MPPNRSRPSQNPEPLPRWRSVLPSLAKTAIAFLLLLLLLVSCPLPSWAATAQPDPVPLTLELLRTRLKTPTQTEGSRTIDLRHLIIDLRPDNAEFREQFYQLVREQIQRSTIPLGLDLSYSRIRGELKISDLALRIPLYGKTLPPFFNPAEQAQFERDRRRLSQLNQLSRSLLLQTRMEPVQITVLRGTLRLAQTQFEGFVNFTYTFFLGRVDAPGAIFTQDVDWSGSRFSRKVTLSGAVFQQAVRWRNAIFFDRVRLNQVEFQSPVNLQSSEFQATANFNQSIFHQSANLSRIVWQDNVDFSQTHWQDKVWFERDKFGRSLFLTEATFEKAVSFRQAQFNRSVNLRGASLLDQTDFADASFAKGSYLNVANLQFDPKQAVILGDPGQIGKVLSVPNLEGNETVMRNLVQNFWELQQLGDANEIEYTIEKIRAREQRQRLLGTNINQVSRWHLQSLGFSKRQADAILEARQQNPIRSFNELLQIGGVDFSTYVKVRDRISVGEPLTPIDRILFTFRWLGLSILLLLTRYGTRVGLIFGIEMIGIAHFGVMFWLIDRFRRLRPKPIVPSPAETAWLISGFSALTLTGLAIVFQSSDQPWLTLACMEATLLPIPLLLLIWIYWQGRYHDQLTTTYFVEDGTLRQLRFLIGRLPIIPDYPFFRERYIPIQCDRRWGWLIYFDFSLNNLLKFGFNDIRLRDEHVPGLVTTLVWYQWGIGMFYFALLLWTLSRTIPGLNLLIYFK
ncbi:pentapeptide repeat-containing protein [Egbenema bharatensis]|uniref:pentapeptide repeat-containing protein n=1 Tax=Egbenema bharatensis TaxID=3463334 RepID=UPI003A864AC6